MTDIHSYEPLWKNWVVDEEIGEGSFGSVWKAHRVNEYSSADQLACIKHISIPHASAMDDIAGFSSDALKDYYADQLARLVQEIEAMIKLRGKPHIVSYEEHLICSKPVGFGYDLFLRMELLTNLNKYVEQNGTPDHDTIVKLAVHIAKAISVLESQNYIHRDIKPTNIFVDNDGDFKLGDFGTARVLSQDGNASTNVGTPSYMAPEVYTLSSSYDQTVDLYSLGIVLYYYLNDKMLPFERECTKPDAALSRRIGGEKLPKPINADDALAAIVLKMCAYDPADRYQTANELLRELDTYKFSRKGNITSNLDDSLYTPPVEPEPPKVPRPAPPPMPPVRPNPPIPKPAGIPQPTQTRPHPGPVPPRPPIPRPQPGSVPSQGVPIQPRLVPVQQGAVPPGYPVPPRPPVPPVPPAQPASRKMSTSKLVLLIVLICLVVLVLGVIIVAVVSAPAGAEQPSALLRDAPRALCSIASGS